MHPNLFSGLPWDPLLNEPEQAQSWQGAGPAPQPRVQRSAWEPGALCRLQGLAALPASLTQPCTQAPWGAAQLQGPRNPMSQPRAPAGGTCNSLGSPHPPS